MSDRNVMLSEPPCAPSEAQGDTFRPALHPTPVLRKEAEAVLATEWGQRLYPHLLAMKRHWREVEEVATWLHAPVEEVHRLSEADPHFLPAARALIVQETLSEREKSLRNLWREKAKGFFSPETGLDEPPLNALVLALR